MNCPDCGRPRAQRGFLSGDPTYCFVGIGNTVWSLQDCNKHTLSKPIQQMPTPEVDESGMLVCSRHCPFYTAETVNWPDWCKAPLKDFPDGKLVSGLCEPALRSCILELKKLGPLLEAIKAWTDLHGAGSSHKIPETIDRVYQEALKLKRS